MILQRSQLFHNFFHFWKPNSRLTVSRKAGIIDTWFWLLIRANFFIGDIHDRVCGKVLIWFAFHETLQHHCVTAIIHIKPQNTTDYKKKKNQIFFSLNSTILIKMLHNCTGPLGNSMEKPKPLATNSWQMSEIRQILLDQQAMNTQVWVHILLSFWPHAADKLGKKYTRSF